MIRDTMCGIARVLSKSFTFIFAVFCLVSGLMTSPSASTLHGKVINRVNFSPVQGIRIIMSDFICPLYGIGMGFSCTPNHALDTAITNGQGLFSLNGTKIRYAFNLSDMDSLQNGSFLPYATIQSYPDTNTGITFYSMPKGGTYSVHGKVINSKNNEPIQGIKIQLFRPFNAPYPSTYVGYDSLSSEHFSDANGLFSFDLSTMETNAVIKAVDVDSSAGSPWYIDAQSGTFSPFSDTSIVVIPLTEKATSVRLNLNNTKAIQPITCSISQGMVSIRIDKWNVTSQRNAIVFNSQGKSFAHLPIEPGGFIHWNPKGIARGVYFIQIPYNLSFLNLPIMLP